MSDQDLDQILEELDPGDQFPGETDLAYEAFTIYRDQPPGERSLKGVADRDVGGKKRPQRTVERWSSSYHWVKRCQKWDQARRASALDRVKEAREEELARFFEKQYEVSERFVHTIDMGLTIAEHWIRVNHDIWLEKILKAEREEGKRPELVDFEMIMPPSWAIFVNRLSLAYVRVSQREDVLIGIQEEIDTQI